jgi:hypothetical protein
MLFIFASLAMITTSPAAAPQTIPKALQGTLIINAHWQGKPFSLRRYMRTHFNIGSLFGGPASPRQASMAIKVCISAPDSMDCGIYQSKTSTGEALPLSLILPMGDYDVQVWPVSFKPQAQTQNVHIATDKIAPLGYTFQWPKGLR